MLPDIDCEKTRDNIVIKNDSIKKENIRTNESLSDSWHSFVLYRLTKLSEILYFVYFILYGINAPLNQEPFTFVLLKIELTIICAIF